MPKSSLYQKGAIIFFEGDREDTIYILQSGSVVLTSRDLTSGDVVTEQIHVGEFFGVKSALSHMPRMETATVRTDSQIIVLTVAEFESIFSKNQEIILKMMKVFSSQLRKLHAKTESILQKEVTATVPEDDMLNIAQHFYDDGQYHSCVSECKQILEMYPEAQNKSAVESLLQDASNKAKDETPFFMDTEFLNNTNNEANVAASQFDSPVFDRFSKDYESGDVIISEYEPGDKFYVIKKGDVQLLKNIDGSLKTLDIIHAGEFFGEMAILDNSPRSATCIARGPVKCLVFDKTNFSSLITGNAQMAIKLLKLFCKRIYDQRRMLKILVIKDMNIRIADVFCMYEELTVDGNKESSQSQKRKFHLTYGDIAHWTGIPLDDCQSLLKVYADHHKIETYDGYIIVNNIADMKRMVDTYDSVRK